MPRRIQVCVSYSIFNVYVYGVAVLHHCSWCRPVVSYNLIDNNNTNSLFSIKIYLKPVFRTITSLLFEDVLIWCMMPKSSISIFISCFHFPTSCSNTSSTPSPCGVKFYSVVGTADCISCPVGHYCPSTTTASPVACPSGYYNLQLERSECVICPRGLQILSMFRALAK